MENKTVNLHIYLTHYIFVPHLSAERSYYMKLIHVENDTSYSTNTFILISNSGNAAVIDPSVPMSEINDILSANNAKLTHIMLTHGHYDHVGGVNYLKEKHNAAIYLGEGDVSKYDARLFKINEGDADFTFKDGDVIAIDEILINVIATPGHSRGSVCLYEENEGILFSGDTVFKQEIGRCDLTGSDYSAMLKSLKKLKEKVTPSAQVLPGHGEFSTMQHELMHNPYLKQA